MSKPHEPAFSDLLAMMREGNPQVAEDGFHYLRPRAKEHVDELLTALGNETNHAMQCWLLQLIGEAKSEKGLVALCAYAKSQDDSLKSWAVQGLVKLNTRQAKTFLKENGLAPLKSAQKK
jgi:hypothetical protein